MPGHETVVSAHRGTTEEFGIEAAPETDRDAFSELVSVALRDEAMGGREGVYRLAADERPFNRSRRLLAASVLCVALGVGAFCASVLALEGVRFTTVLEIPRARELVSSVDTGATALSRGDREDASSGWERPEPGAAPGGVEIDASWVRDISHRTGIPERALSAYAAAASRIAQEQPGCGLGWNTLAGIGWVESEHGHYRGSRIGVDGLTRPAIIGVPLDGVVTNAIHDTDGGVLDGDVVWDRAVGPMQFIPSTWASWGSDGNGDGVADPQHIDDAAYSAARYLCADDVDLRVSEHWIAAVAAYNDSIEYNHRVAAAAENYARRSSG